ncbi:glycosyltransferase [Viridibacillus sp. YIM B01967]|uniref:Glycosyltransferase n=1 Tax=Viridibacillus soli TaxID=2798301 RepID=A0ABS1H858_9BACL|nr:glycosyltransferase [Viridibacillus soli]MBK3495602.1 glycosyltransferase [Viridibacillus soli]
MRKIFMAIWDIDVDKYGVNSVMYKRASLLNNADYCSELITLDYKNNYPEIELQLKKEGRLVENVKITNIYDYYKKRYTTSGPTEESIKNYRLNSEKFEPDFQVEDCGESAHYFQNGAYVKYKCWDKDGRLCYIDYFTSENDRLKREEFHNDGYMNRELYYHPTNNELNQELYHTPDGFCYLTKWYNNKTGKQQKVYLFNLDTKETLSFANNKELQVHWLNEICKNEPEKPIIICDGPGSSNRIRSMESDLAHRIYAIHTNHYEAPYTYGSPLKEKYIGIMENAKNGDPIIVLTDKQKTDIIKQFGEYNNIHVIPNVVEARDVDIAKKDPLLVTVVARLDEGNAVEEAVHAFVNVIQEVPDAKLHIYGDGPKRRSLAVLIRKLKLRKNVELKGYTTNSDAALAKATVTVVTAKYEGFSLAALESFANKTPVVIYDTNYYIEEFQSAGKNGYAVPNNDREQLADKIIYLLQNPDEAQQMGGNAYHTIQTKYTPGHQYKQWTNLFNSLTT